MFNILDFVVQSVLSTHLLAALLFNQYCPLTYWLRCCSISTVHSPTGCVVVQSVLSTHLLAALLFNQYCPLIYWLRCCSISTVHLPTGCVVVQSVLSTHLLAALLLLFLSSWWLLMLFIDDDDTSPLKAPQNYTVRQPTLDIDCVHVHTSMVRN